MKYTDEIIKYLSEEMTQEEAAHFRIQVSSDRDLEIELQQIQNIWTQLKVILELDEAPTYGSREELIAEIIAEHDIGVYRSENESEKAKELKKTMAKIMSAEANMHIPANKKKRRIIYFLSLASAALIAMMLIIQQPWHDINSLTESYFTLGEETLFKESCFLTRGDSVQGIDLFRKQQYGNAKKLFEVELQLDPNNRLTNLCYGLSCYECGYPETAIEILTELASDNTSDLSDLSAWYLSLILIKEEQPEKSKAWLILVKKRDCPYSSKANRLLKRM